MFRLFQGRFRQLSVFSTPAFLNTQWGNPFGQVSATTLRGVMLRSLVIMQSLPSARAQWLYPALASTADQTNAICFHEAPGSNPSYGPYALYVGMDGYRVATINAAYSVLLGERSSAALRLDFISLPISLEIPGCSGNPYSLSTCVFEKATNKSSFHVMNITGGGNSKFAYEHNPNPGIVVHVTGSTKALRNGQMQKTSGFTPDEIVFFGLFGSVASLALLSTLCALARYIPRRRRRVVAARAFNDALNDIDNADDAWMTLLERLDELAPSDEVAKLKSTIKATYDEYLCGISYSIIVEPVTLPCEHSYEKAALEQYRTSQAASSRQTQCPCCLKPFNENDMVVNSDMKAEIVAKLGAFTKAVNAVIASQPKRNEGGSSSASSSTSASDSESASSSASSAENTHNYLLPESPLSSIFSSLSSSSASSSTSASSNSSSDESLPAAGMSDFLLPESSLSSLFSSSASSSESESVDSVDNSVSPRTLTIV